MSGSHREIGANVSVRMSLNLAPEHRAKLIELARHAIEVESNPLSSRVRRMKRFLAKLEQPCGQAEARLSSKPGNGPNMLSDEPQ
jgi:hypothetical protein